MGNVVFTGWLPARVLMKPLAKTREMRRTRIGVFNGGLHAAESLIIARYSMFKQVYFHKTRMAFQVSIYTT